MKRFNKRHVLLIILVSGLMGMFLPVKLNYRFRVTALVYPSAEWTLKRSQDDSYISELRNYTDNSLSDLKNYKFERGDISEVKLKNGIEPNSLVLIYDTIAYLHSFFIKNELTRLYNQKHIEELQLVTSITGSKQSLIAQSQQEYEFARQQFSLQEKNYLRQKKLMRDSIISAADFEVYENDFQLAEINVKIKENELLTAKSGLKTEELEVIKQKIESYNREIETIETLESQYHIVSPIQGVLRFSSISDVILNVSDTSRFILKIPVKVHNIQFLERLSSIQFSLPGVNQKLDAHFIGFDENVNLYSNQQIVVANASISGKLHKIYPGTAVDCTVFCDKVTLFEFLRREITLGF